MTALSEVNWYESLPHKIALIEALESGKYAKGLHRLRDVDDNWCCWGVACDISGLGEYVSVDVSELDHRVPNSGEYQNKASYWAFQPYQQNGRPSIATNLLPEQVARWLGGDPPARDGVEHAGFLLNINGLRVVFHYNGEVYDSLYQLNDVVSTFGPIIAALKSHVNNPTSTDIVV